MTRVLVVGAAGFVGASLLRDLIQRPGVHAVGWIRPGGKSWRTDRISAASVVPCDLTDSPHSATALERLQPDIVINAAAAGVASAQTLDPAHAFRVNVDGVFNLLSACRALGVKRFLQLGSYFEYGDQSAPLREDGPVAPKTTYAATKAAAGLLVAGIDHTPLEAVVLRLFNVWGPWEDTTRLIPQVISACRTGTPLALSSGTQAKDYSSVRDVAAWIGDLALRPSPLGHRIVNVATGQMTTVRDLVTTVATQLGRMDLMHFGERPMPTGEPQTGPADITRLTALLPARRITPAAETLAEILREDFAS